MSPPASGAYQSRLLNFVSRQTRRWTEQGTRTLRHLKVAATWAAQILVYPIYAVVQAVRLAGRQLHQVVVTELPRLNQEKTPPDSDRAIERVMPIALQFLGEWKEKRGDLTKQEDFIRTESSLEMTDAGVVPQPSLPSGLVIQSIATLLETRSLVLVTPENLLLDILNPEQQWQLRQWIIWEIADYWSDRRSTLAPTKRNTFLPLPVDRPHLLPPVRILWQLVRWMQTSPLALAVDLFQESALIKYYEQEGLAQFGEAVFIPTGATFWLTMEDLFESRRLGSVQSWHLTTSDTTTEAITAIPIRGNLAAVAPDSAELVLASSEAIETAGSPFRGLPSSLKAYFHFRRLPLQQKLATEAAPSVIAPTLAATTALPEARSAPSPTSITSTSDRLGPDWIEAKVVPVGYVKHPLERVLEWVDRLMFWLEEATIATGRWFKQHW